MLKTNNLLDSYVWSLIQQTLHVYLQLEVAGEAKPFKNYSFLQTAT